MHAQWTEHLKRWTRAEYDHVVKLGAFEGQRVELLRGAIVEKEPQSTGHASPIHKATGYLVRLVGDRADVRVQLPFAASDDSEPEPDFALVEPGEYLDDHPSAAYLVIEVAASSLRYDRDKSEVYAAARVPEYWILDVERQRIERYLDPAADGYQTRSTHERDAVLELVALPGMSVAVDSLLPKPRG